MAYNMTDQDKASLADSFAKLINKSDTVRARWYRPAVSDGEENGFEKFKPSETTYLFITVGPETPVEAVLEHNFNKLCDRAPR